MGSHLIQTVNYIPICKQPITSHHSYHVTIQYPTVLYGCYWTVIIVQLSAVDLTCKVNDKSHWPRKASERGAGLFRLIVCKQNTSVNILFIINNNRLLDSLVVQCWLRVREVPGSIPSQGLRHTKDVIKMVPVLPLFSTKHSKGKILALSQELR